VNDELAEALKLKKIRILSQNEHKLKQKLREAARQQLSS